jgi:hypothetical protein
VEFCGVLLLPDILQIPLYLKPHFESQQWALIAKGVLVEISFWVSYLRKDREGGPAAKFMYYIIRTKYPIDQSELANISHLPRRTVQAAIEELKKTGANN